MSDARIVAGYSILASGIDSDDTSISLASGTGARFPATGSWLAFVYDSIFPNFAVAYQNGYAEVMQITSRSTDTLTVGTRAFVDPQSKGAKSFNTTGRTYRIEMNVQDASATASGDVNLTTQYFSGLKIFTDHAAVGEESTTTGKVRIYTAGGVEYGEITSAASLDSNRTWTLPNSSGTVALTSDISSYSNLPFAYHSGIGSGVTRYIIPAMYTVDDTDGDMRYYMSSAGTVQSFTITGRPSVDPVSTTTDVYTLRKNGQDTAITLSIQKVQGSGIGQMLGTSSGSAVSFVVGDWIDIKVVNGGGSFINLAGHIKIILTS